MPSNYVLLNRLQLTSSSSSITFSNIPQSGYTDLKLVMSARHDGAQVGNAFYLKFNGSSTNQTAKFIEGAGSGTPGSGSNNNPYGGVDVGASSTSNTFNNCEIYIPSYASSNYKSYLSDSISENNATTSYVWLTSGLWSSTSPITSVSIMPDTVGKNYVAGSTFSLYGIAAVGATPLLSPYAAGGDSVVNDGTYWYHTFLSSGIFTPLKPLTCNYLIVGGGGGGGSNYRGGGGGGGGLRSTVTATGGGGTLESALSVTKDNPYTVAVGSGGAANNNGTNSTFSTITALGGGSGGNGSNNGTNAGYSGGSGGGGCGVSGGDLSGGAGTTNQGYAGGNAVFSASAYGGGGGGAGASGTNPNGGNGVAIATLASATGTGSSNYYAGGGGGGGFWSGGSPGSPAPGGAGGGGAGSKERGGNVSATPGSYATGGGGGGGAEGAPGAAGGSGLVIIRYAI